MKRKWDLQNDESRRKCIDEVITRLREQAGSDFGQIIAEDIIDIVTQNIGPDIYNAAVTDAKKLIENKFSDIAVELDVLSSND